MNLHGLGDLGFTFLQWWGGFPVGSMDTWCQNIKDGTYESGLMQAPSRSKQTQWKTSGNSTKKLHKHLQKSCIWSLNIECRTSVSFGIDTCQECATLHMIREDRPSICSVGANATDCMVFPITLCVWVSPRYDHMRHIIYSWFATQLLFKPRTPKTIMPKLLPINSARIWASYICQ